MSGGLRVNAFILDMFWHWLSHLESISICVALEVIALVPYFWGSCADVLENSKKMFLLESHFDSSPLPGTKVKLLTSYITFFKRGKKLCCIYYLKLPRHFVTMYQIYLLNLPIFVTIQDYTRKNPLRLFVITFHKTGPVFH